MPRIHFLRQWYGQQWYGLADGAMARIGVDVASGVVHAAKGTAANKADINQMAAAPHGAKEDVFRCRLYRSRRAART
jgi:IS5 family transposase